LDVKWKMQQEAGIKDYHDMIKQERQCINCILSNPCQSMIATSAGKAGNIFKTLQGFNHRAFLVMTYGCCAAKSSRRLKGD
jgi:hypothetical protein